MKDKNNCNLFKRVLNFINYFQDDKSQISSDISSDNFISASSSTTLNAELDKVTDASNLEIAYVKILKSELDQIMDQIESQEQILKEMKASNESSVAQCNILVKFFHFTSK